MASTSRGSKINVLQALMSHGTVGEIEMPNGTTLVEASNDSPRRRNRRGRSDSVASSTSSYVGGSLISDSVLISFSEDKSMDDYELLSEQQTSPFSEDQQHSREQFKLNDSGNIVNYRNEVFVKMEYAKAQTQTVIDDFSKAKMEFEQQIAELNRRVEREEEEKTRKIQELVEDFNSKSRIMLKKYKAKLNKKNKEAFQGLSKRLANISEEKEQMKKELLLEVERYYEENSTVIAQLQIRIQELSEGAELQLLKKQLKDQEAQSKKQFEMQKRMFMALLAYLRQREHELANNLLELQRINLIETSLRDRNRELETTINTLQQQEQKLFQEIETKEGIIATSLAESIVEKKDTTDNVLKQLETAHSEEIIRMNGLIEQLQKESNELNEEKRQYSESLQLLQSSYETVQLELRKSSKTLSDQEEMLSQKELIDYQLALSQNKCKELEEMLSIQKEENEQLVREVKEKGVLLDRISSLVEIKKQQKRRSHIEHEALAPSNDNVNKVEEGSTESDNLLEENSPNKKPNTLKIDFSYPPSSASFSPIQKDSSSQTCLEEAIEVPSQDSSRTQTANFSQTDVVPVSDNSFQTENCQEQESGIQTETTTQEFNFSQTDVIESKSEISQTNIVDLQSVSLQTEIDIKSIEQQTENDVLDNIAQTDPLEEKVILQKETIIEKEIVVDHSEIDYLRNELTTLKFKMEKQVEQFNITAQQDLENALQRNEKTKRLIVLHKEEEISRLNNILVSLRREIEERNEQDKSLKLDFSNHEKLQMFVSKMQRQLGTTVAELTLLKAKKDEDEHHLQQMKKELDSWKLKYKVLLDQSNYRCLQSSVDLQEEITNLAIENSKLREYNSSLLVKLNTELNEPSNSFENAYFKEKQVTDQLSEQCREFVLKVTVQEQIINEKMCEIEELKQELSRQKESTEKTIKIAAKRVEREGKKNRVIEELSTLLREALITLSKNNLEHNYYSRVAKIEKSMSNF